MSTSLPTFPGNTINGVNELRRGKTYLIPIVFPPGQSVVTFDLQLGERITAVRNIELLSYSFTLADPPLGQDLPSLVRFGTYNQGFFSCNTFYGPYGDNESIPIALGHSSVTPSGNNRFSHTYDEPLVISEFEPKTNKKLPSNAKFYLACTSSTLLPAPPANQPGNQAPLTSVTFSGESCVLLRVHTWEEHIEYISQNKKNISKSYYLY